MSSSSSLKKFAIVKRKPAARKRLISKPSTEKRRLRDMKLSPQRLAARKASWRANSRRNRLKKQTALTLLQLQDKEAYEELVSKNRDSDTDRQRQMRNENKRPTLAQATKLLKRFDEKFGTKSVLRRKGKEANDQSAKYGTLGASFVYDVGEKLKLSNKRWKTKNWMTVTDIGSGLGLLGFYFALVFGVRVILLEKRASLNAKAIRIGNALKKICEQRGWRGVGDWRIVEGDARETLIDSTNLLNGVQEEQESIIIRTIDNNNNNHAATSTKLTKIDEIPTTKCIAAQTDLALLNHFIIEDFVSLEIFSKFAQYCPENARIVFTRNPQSRLRPSNSKNKRTENYGENDFALERYNLATAMVNEIPVDAVEWGSTKTVHWACLEVLPVGVLQRDLPNQVMSTELREMTLSLIK